MRKKLTAAVLLLALAIPALAVFKEKNIKQTLLVLQEELQTEYSRVMARNNTSARRVEAQHKSLVELVEKSNELSLMLYSQPQDYTFDLTYALHQVTKQYEDFNANKVPFDQIVESMTVELNRYNKLVQTLRNMPPVRVDPSAEAQETVTVMDSIDVSVDTMLVVPLFAIEEGFHLDSASVIVRDSCLVMAQAMVDHYWESIRQIEEDNEYYADTDKVLKDAYDYAQNRYQVVQKKVFLDGQNNYFRILESPARYLSRVKGDLQIKYGARESGGVVSSWRGPIVAIYSVAMLLVLIVAIILATLLVNLVVKLTPRFQNDYTREHKGMIITLTGVILFAIFILVNGATAEDSSFIPMASRMMGEFAALLGAIFLSMLIRLDKAQTKAAVLAYLPTLILAFIVVYLRTIFIPNSALNLFFPPVVLLFTIWQLVANLLELKKVPGSDRALLWVSFSVMAVSTAVAWYGLVMMALLILIWWLFQLILMQALTAISLLIDRNYDKSVKKRQLRYRKRHPDLPLTSEKGAFIEVSWAHDFMRMAIVPILATWSLPLAISLACKVFNLSVIATEFFFKPIVNVEGIVHLSLFKVVFVVSLFFLFRYLVYAVKAFYRVLKTKKVLKHLGSDVAFKESDINFNLANNIITLVLWGVYVIVAFRMLKIPTSALTIITTGLATGIGFALKDVLNNFFYGVQLMGGRVRVGDTIECDGIRGVVRSLSYQSTQIEAEGGALVAFSNTNLFNKNFKNLTRNHQYEMINFTVGVKYGTDVEKARKVIVEALQPLLVKDKYGHEVVDMKKGINVRLKEFGDSSVDIQVLLYATVEAHYTFAAAAKEAIYNAFNENGIEIPFPQSDVYVKQMP